MSVMFEVLYKAPVDLAREAKIVATVARHGGAMTFHEVPMPDDVSQAVVLTIEFDNWPAMEAAAAELIQQGEHVEGGVEYGDD